MFKLISPLLKPSNRYLTVVPIQEYESQYYLLNTVWGNVPQCRVLAYWMLLVVLVSGRWLLLWLAPARPILMFVSLQRYVTQFTNGLLIVVVSTNCLHFRAPPLLLQQDETSFVVAHFTGERCYTITERWLKANSTYLPQSDDVILSLLSSSVELLCLLAR